MKKQKINLKSVRTAGGILLTLVAISRRHISMVKVVVYCKTYAVFHQVKGNYF